MIIAFIILVLFVFWSFEFIRATIRPNIYIITLIPTIAVVFGQYPEMMKSTSAFLVIHTMSLVLAGWIYCLIMSLKRMRVAVNADCSPAENNIGLVFVMPFFCFILANTSIGAHLYGIYIMINNGIPYEESLKVYYEDRWREIIPPRDGVILRVIEYGVVFLSVTCWWLMYYLRQRGRARAI